MIGLLVGVAVGYTHGGNTWSLVIKLLGCAIPVFAAGLIEDLTKRVSVKARLLASFASALLAVWSLDATLLRLDTPVLDDLMTWGPVALLFTSFAVAGMTNAINIIDGLNGLAAGAVGLMLAGLAGIAWQAGDMQVFKLCFWGIAAMVGFLGLNYPFGRIFLGDGGAYLAGFWLAECAVMLLHRNPEVSTWAVLLCVMYPCWETLYSIYRRQFKQGTSSGAPDAVHFHHLVFKVINQHVGKRLSIWQRHGIASASIWLMTALCQVAAIYTMDSTGLAMACVIGFVAVYGVIYSWMGSEDEATPQPQTEALKA